MKQKRTLPLAKIATLLVVVFITFSCSKEDTNDIFDPQYLVEYTEVTSLTSDEVKLIVEDSNLFPEESTFFIRYGIKGIRIVYNTVSPNGEPILASGALIVPNNANPMPLLSLQHGTIIEDISAPSYFMSDYNDLAVILASTGYIMALPDYLGYGASNNIEHPYEHRVSLATSTRDMIRASYEYLKLTTLNQPNNKLFISGYSEGGFATMATFKLLQEEHSNEFNITAVTVGAGAVNKTAFMDWVVNSTEDLRYINTFVWVLDVYNKLYPELQRPYDYYFNEPWATIIEENGVYRPIELNPSLLFREEFIEGIKNRTDTPFISAVADNDCYNWLPLSPLRLYHGTDDMLVPYFNSETAYNAMVELGATDIELITSDGGDHGTTVADYIFGTFLFFQGFQDK